MDESKLDEATDLVCRFSRCVNYPRTTPEMQALASGLIEASEARGVSMQIIVSRWASRSQFCPTDADLVSTAGEIATELREREEQQNREAELARWKRESRGVPQGMSINAKPRNGVIERERLMWSELRREFGVTRGNWPEWPAIARAMRKLGYNDYADALGINA